MWGMRQHGESTRSCERPPPNKQRRKIGAETTARNSWSCASLQMLKFCEWWRELVPTTALIQDPWSLWITLNISSTLSLVHLVFSRPSKGSVWESTQTHVGAGTRALLGPHASASRRRALRGAAQGGADVVSRFPLLAPEACCGALRTRKAPAPQKFHQLLSLLHLPLK